MPHELLIVRAADRRLRKLPVQVRKHLIEATQILRTQPLTGKQLDGELRRFRCLRTVYRRTHYRIVYQVQRRPPQVIIRAVGTRQNFYRELQTQKLK